MKDEKDEKGEKNENNHVYVGNKIPLIIKLVWFIFLSWLFYYLIVYSYPDLKLWLSK